MLEAYETGLAKLAERVRQINESDWSPTPERKECERIAKLLAETATALKSTTARTTIDSTHKALGAPVIVTGLDGWPVEHAPYYFDWPESRTIVAHMELLAESAQQAADELPDPRYKHALPHAAMGLLQLRLWYDLPPATVYIDGDANLDLQHVGQLAGLALSPAAYLKALRVSVSEFDRDFRPPEFHYLFR